MQMIRQGDVLLIPIDSVPKGAKSRKKDRGRVVLAYGEVTGHAHVIDDRATLPAELFDTDRGAVLVVAPGSELVHTADFGTFKSTEEHGSVKVEGTFLVRNQRQYTPWGEQNVRD